MAIQLIQISDSRFQKQLISEAQRANKLSNYFHLAPRFQNNLPVRYQSQLKVYKGEGMFPAFPLGSDFTSEEIQLGRALMRLKSFRISKIAFLGFAFLSLLTGQEKKEFSPLLERMGLRTPKIFKEFLYKKLICKALST